MKFLSVLRKDLLLLLRDRGQLLTLFLSPLAFIIPISIAFPANGYLRQSDMKPFLPVVNYDVHLEGETLAVGEQAQLLLDFLAEGFQLESDFLSEDLVALGISDEPACALPGLACDELVARARVEHSYRETAVIIPAGFSAAIAAKKPVTVTLYYDLAGDSITRQINQAVLSGGTLQLSIQNQVFGGFNQLEDLLTFAPEEVQTEIRARWAAVETKNDGGDPQQPALSVVSLQPTSYTLVQRPDTYQQTVPGYTVLFVFFIVSFLSAAVRSERNAGTLRRLLHMPVQRSQILGGKVGAGLLVGLAQVSIMFAIGHFAFGMGLGQAPLALALLTISVVAAAVAIGLAAAAYDLQNVLTVPLIATGLIGGCMFPADWLPPFVRTIAYAVPQYWAMRGFQDLLVRGQGLTQVLPAIGMLLLFAALFFGLAVRRLDFGQEA